MKYNDGIGKIKYGEIQFFFPFTLNTTMSYEEIQQKIGDSLIALKKDNIEEIENALGNALNDICNKVERLSQEQELNIKVTELQNTKESSYKIESKDTYINLSEVNNPHKSGILMELKHRELEALKQRTSFLEKENNIFQNIYGRKFLEEHKRIVLLPFKITLCNEMVVWAQVILYLFANKMIILKIELPLLNVGITPFLKNQIDLFVTKIENNWLDGASTSCKRISEIPEMYLKTIGEETKSDVIKYNLDFRHIVLADFEGMPKYMNNLSNQLQEELYRIICAPVPERKNISCLKEAKEYIEANSFGKQDIRYIVKTTGGCLSFIDCGCINEYKLAFLKKTGYEVQDEWDYYYVCNSIVRELQINSELALIVVMLKKINASADFYQKESYLRDLYEIRNNYNWNKIFISGLQEGCYGSVSEQIEFFQKHMQYYLMPDLMQEKQVAINNLIEKKVQNEKERLQNGLALSGLFFSIIFGLPAICETFVIIRKIMYFVRGDIPYITIENISVITWMVVVVIIGRKLYKKK